MYFTDRGIEELAERRAGEEGSPRWLAARVRAFVGASPADEAAGHLPPHPAPPPGEEAATTPPAAPSAGGTPPPAPRGPLPHPPPRCR